jgi:hypothetical protein
MDHGGGHSGHHMPGGGGGEMPMPMPMCSVSRPSAVNNDDVPRVACESGRNEDEDESESLRTILKTAASTAMRSAGDTAVHADPTAGSRAAATST